MSLSRRKLDLASSGPVSPFAPQFEDVGLPVPRRRRPATLAARGTPLHGLSAAGDWSRYLPPLPQDEADLFDAGEAGHETIESEALLPLTGDPAIVAAIYFGNWQRDLSQLLAPALHQHLGDRAGFACALIFEVVDLLAEAKFNRRLSREGLGTYRWEEHIDNPRDFGMALRPKSCQPFSDEERKARCELEPERGGSLCLWEEGADATPLYLHYSRRYVRRELARALQLGRNAAGFERFGNAMHTVEDFYAHSNFIELGYNLRHGEDPHTGRDLRGESLRDSRNRYRLTTGIFQKSDSLVSLGKLLLHHLETPPGGRVSPLGSRVRRVLIRRLLGAGALKVYDELHEFLQSTRIPELVRRVEESIERTVLYPLRLAVAALLRPLADAAARQTGRDRFCLPAGSAPRCIREISHSLLSKDDPKHRYHAVARQLAIRAVRDFWCAMEAAWRGEAPAFARLLEVYMGHPLAVGRWWMPILEGRPLPAARCGRAAPPALPPGPQPVTPMPSPPISIASAPPPRPGPPAGARLAVLDGFAFGSAALTPGHRVEIERVAGHLARLAPAGRVVRLIGHTDNVGSASYNLKLGDARAQTVARALAEALERRGGKQRVRQVIASRGAARPVADNGTPQGRAKNRRVVILLAPAASPPPRPARV